MNRRKLFFRTTCSVKHSLKYLKYCLLPPASFRSSSFPWHKDIPRSKTYFYQHLWHFSCVILIESPSILWLISAQILHRSGILCTSSLIPCLSALLACFTLNKNHDFLAKMLDKKKAHSCSCNWTTVPSVIDAFLYDSERWRHCSVPRILYFLSGVTTGDTYF